MKNYEALEYVKSKQKNISLKLCADVYVNAYKIDVLTQHIWKLSSKIDEKIHIQTGSTQRLACILLLLN